MLGTYVYNIVNRYGLSLQACKGSEKEKVTAIAVAAARHDVAVLKTTALPNGNSLSVFDDQTFKHLQTGHQAQIILKLS